jgi:hypothetical protein
VPVPLLVDEGDVDEGEVPSSARIALRSGVAERRTLEAAVRSKAVRS